MSRSSSHPSSGSGSGPQQSDGLAGCALQLAWSFGGSGVVLILWITILREPTWTITFKDGLYWATVAGMIVARYLYVTRYEGSAAERESTAKQGVLGFAWILIAISALAWVGAQAFSL